MEIKKLYKVEIIRGDTRYCIAKDEKHYIDGKQRLLCVHRKGATRAYPPGHLDIPSAYRDLGQPVIIPGSMGNASWLLVGAKGSLAASFGSSSHGAGRNTAV